MRHLAIAAIAGALLAAAVSVSVRPTPAAADTNFWTGTVVHVSTTNIKVDNTKVNQTLSFLLTPKFKQVFSDDGKTTYQMASIKAGMTVKVVYDQDLLGARHADKIFVLNANGQPLKTL